MNKTISNQLDKYIAQTFQKAFTTNHETGNTSDSFLLTVTTFDQTV